jgi:hypothetical protein
MIQSISRLQYNFFEHVSLHKFKLLALNKHMENSWSLEFYLGIEIMVFENRFGRDAKC